MDLERIEALLKLMREYKVGEIAYEDEGLSVTVTMGGAAAPAVAMAQMPAPVAHAAPEAAAAPAAAAASAQKGHIVKSPMVGTFYRSAKPGTPALVDVGSKVKVGQVLCILEAMKLMNELESDVAGTVAEIYLANASPVQFGQDLFRIVPD
jgi:acetyl-CoA carboxylase biotin carboxyl carrier protein